MSHLPNVLMIGTGEYTTGFVNGAASNSDKSAGIIALTIFDLRSRHLCGKRVGLCGTNGTKLPLIRAHLHKHIHQRYGLDTTCDTFPEDDVGSDENAYLKALDTFKAGDVVIITTPDQTHAIFALEAVKRGMHALVAKPIVKTLEEHASLVSAAAEKGVLVCGEYHKRWDPMYSDAYNRIRSGTLGSLIYFNSYMSQPKTQLTTFAQWVTDKKKSDISYYLNAHHVDFLCVALQGRARPYSVVALASSGCANDYLANHNQKLPKDYDIEDSITLMVQFNSVIDSSVGCAVFTSSWTAPKSDSHTQQRFHYLGHTGEINIDQARRGYNSATDGAGYATNNPLFFRYQPDVNGAFAGQSCYGYGSFAHFISAAAAVNNGQSTQIVTRTMELANVNTDACYFVSAILEAGRRSLDNNGKKVIISYDDKSKVSGLSFE